MKAKGRTDAGVIRGFCRYLFEAGLNGPLRLRSDSEPATQAVAQDIANRRAPAVTFVETSPVGSFSSLGSAERMVRTIAGQTRVLRVVTEEMAGTSDSHVADPELDHLARGMDP